MLTAKNHTQHDSKCQWLSPYSTCWAVVQFPHTAYFENGSRTCTELSLCLASLAFRSPCKKWRIPTSLQWHKGSILQYPTFQALFSCIASLNEDTKKSLEFGIDFLLLGCMQYKFASSISQTVGTSDSHCESSYLGRTLQVLVTLKEKVLPDAKSMISKVAKGEGSNYPASIAKVRASLWTIALHSWPFEKLDFAHQCPSCMLQRLQLYIICLVCCDIATCILYRCPDAGFGWFL